LVIQAEEMFGNPRGAVAKVCDFLDVAPMENLDYTPQNVGGHSHDDAAAREFLAHFYAPHNRMLAELTGRPFSWAGSARA
jgi:hypothetical protein